MNKAGGDRDRGGRERERKRDRNRGRVPEQEIIQVSMESFQVLDFYRFPKKQQPFILVLLISLGFEGLINIILE